MSWQQLSTREIYRNRWMWLTEDEIETAHGVRATYTVVHKQPFALIIPWDGTHFTLVGQYRYQVDFFSWEFPQGHYEHSSIMETAQHELREETGLRAEKIERLGSFFNAPGALDQECIVFLATQLSQGQADLEETEQDLKVQRVSPGEMETMVLQGKIKDGPTIVALHYFRNNKIAHSRA